MHVSQTVTCRRCCSKVTGLLLIVFDRGNPNHEFLRIHILNTCKLGRSQSHKALVRFNLPSRCGFLIPFLDSAAKICHVLPLDLPCHVRSRPGVMRSKYTLNPQVQETPQAQALAAVPENPKPQLHISDPYVPKPRTLNLAAESKPNAQTVACQALAKFFLVPCLVVAPD